MKWEMHQIRDIVYSRTEWYIGTAVQKYYIRNLVVNIYTTMTSGNSFCIIVYVYVCVTVSVR